MRLTLPLVAAASFVAGVVARYEYILDVHHPRHFIFGYPEGMMQVSERLLSNPSSQTMGDTVWSPGESAIVSILRAHDPTLQEAAVLQFLACALVPVLIAHTAYLAAGFRAACLAMILASLHFGLIHYGGLFLDEQFFQLNVVVSVWATLALLKLDELWPTTQASPRQARVTTVVLGCAVGICWGLGPSFRPNALPILLFVGAALLVHAIWKRAPRRLWMLGGAALGAALTLAPVAERCTVLNGHFCPVTINGAMHVALGQAGEIGGLDFHDPKHPEYDQSWYPPALGQHGYSGSVDVGASIYDTRALLRWVWVKVKKDPFSALVRAVGNAYDLFQMGHWPDDYGPLPPRLVEVSKQGVMFFVVAPGVAGFLFALRDALRRKSKSAVPVLLVASFAGALLTSAVSIGEARFRLPFDGVLIVLGATLMTQGSLKLRHRLSLDFEPWTRSLIGVCAAVSAVTSIEVGLASDPRIGIAQKLARRWQQRPLKTQVEELSAAAYSTRKREHTPFDGTGNYVFSCTPACTELRLALGSLRHDRSVEVSVDWNDDYRLAFYREGVQLWHADLARKPEGSGKGLRIVVQNTPSSIVKGGFDAIGVLPLFGDGHYGLGHLRTFTPR